LIRFSSISWRPLAGMTLPVQTVRRDQFEKITGELDLLVKNHPYVPRADIATQAPQVDHDQGIATANKGASLGYTAARSTQPPGRSPICLR
jgi:methylase of polypeptide subunit release factors